MSSNLDQFYQRFGQAARETAEDLNGRLLVYAEVEDGVVSADLFYLNGAGIVRYRFGTKPLKQLIYSFWEQWKQDGSEGEWRTMCYVVDVGKFRATSDQVESQIQPDRIKLLAKI